MEQDMFGSSVAINNAGDRWILTSAFDIFAMALIHHDKFACCCSMKMMMVRKMYVISV